MVWRYACVFFRILKLFFITGFLLQYLGNWYRTNGPLVNFTIFNTSNKNKAGDINSPWNLLVPSVFFIFIPVPLSSLFLSGKGVLYLNHRGLQLVLTYSWARPAILAAGKGRGWMFLLLLFLHCQSFSFLPYPSLSSPLLSLLSPFSLSLGDDTKWPTRVDVSLNPNTINQSPLL